MRRLIAGMTRNARANMDGGTCHGPSENVIYVAELLNWRVQKLILKP